MYVSVLFNHLINSGFLCSDENEVKTKFSKPIKKQKEKLNNMLNEKQIEEVNCLITLSYCHAFNIRDKECFKMLYLGVKFGMELQTFIQKLDEE